MSLNDELWGWLGKKPEGDFTTDLSLCFKWLVPELQYLNIYYDKGLGFAVFIDAGKVCYDKTGENLALAICLAIKGVKK